MGKDCHRCGSPLSAPEMFCANCGAPQLLYASNGEAADGAVEPGAATLREISWREALGAAVTFAVPMGVLCSSAVPGLAGGFLLWVIGGSIAAVGLYQRRAAVRALTRPAGVRIGTVMGLMAATVASAFNAGALVLERYAMRGGDLMDKAYQTAMENAAQASAPMSEAIAQFFGVPPAEVQQKNLQFFLSPDGRAASVLMSALTFAIGITVFSMIGGALGTRIFSGRGPRNS